MKLHNAMWPGLVGKEPGTDHPPIALDRMLDLTAATTVNGRKFDGPMLLVEKSKLREVSIVAVGADAETFLNIAASLNLSAGEPTPHKGQTNMNKNLMKYIAAKYQLSAEDETGIKAKLSELGRTAEQEETEMKASEAETLRIRAIADIENTRIDGIRAACKGKRGLGLHT